MADKKISALTASTTPLVGTEVLPIVQSGATVKVAVSDLTAGRAISATSVTASTGNFVVGTSGQGIDFSATPGTGTSELLNDYEEGAWTPTLQTTGTNFASVTPAATNGGRYVRVGKIVHLTGYLRTDAVDKTGATGVIAIGGLPFTVATSTGSTRNAWCAATLGTVFNWLLNQPSEAYVTSGTTRIDLLYRTTANGASVDLAIADVATGAGGNALAINVSYLAA